MKALKQLYDWMGTHVHTRYATPVLAFFFFIESSVFFVPVDPLLILYCTEYRQRSWYYATVATTASVIGGAFGYAIGYALWQTVGKFIVTYIISPLTFAKAVTSFEYHQNFAVVVAGISPIPYKAITIGAGFCKLPIVPFVLYSIIARGARFYAIAAVIYKWGDQIKHYIERYFDILAVLFLVVVFGGIWIFKNFF